MDKHVKIVSMVLLVCISFSCKKSKQHKQIKEPEVKPVATARGTLEGTRFEKTIGPAGGSLEVPNSTMRITIPAGAVDTEISFSIQAISNTLGKNGLGTSYRLLPEMEFKQDVELCFLYDAEMINGASEDFLFLAYQDVAGYWHSANKTKIDKVNKTLKVKTKHFSDWMIYAQVKILNLEKQVLKANEQTVLEVNAYKITQSEGQSEYHYLPVATKMDQNDLETWKVLAGDGVITPNVGTTTSFTAPTILRIPSLSKIQVNVKGIKNLRENIDHAYADITVQLAPNEYILWELEEEKFYTVVDRAVMYSDNRTSIKFNGTSPYLNGIKSNLICSFNGIYVGSYKFGALTTSGFASLALTNTSHTGETHTHRSYSTCFEDSKYIVTYTEGKLITSAVDGYIEGRISGTLVESHDFCRVTSKAVKVMFRLQLP